MLTSEGPCLLVFSDLYVCEYVGRRLSGVSQLPVTVSHCAGLQGAFVPLKCQRCSQAAKCTLLMTDGRRASRCEALATL